LASFKCNFKHVNLRGKNARQKLGRQRIEGWLWLFEIYVRNANGGYIRTRQLLEFEEAIGIAKKIAASEAPPLPSRDREGLSSPFIFENLCDPLIRWSEWTSEQKRIFRLRFSVLVLDVEVLGVVSIASNCVVSPDAALVPGNTAWFLMECRGTRGTFHIVTDGVQFYPVKRIPQGRRKYTYKISCELRRSDTIDLNQLVPVDAQRIQIAAREYANWYAGLLA
jgi:hypothetical protein